jgi:hypothetical protein
MASRSFLSVAQSKGCDGDPKKMREAMMEMMGPQAVDDTVRRAISTCWMMLPPQKRDFNTVEAEVRRLVARALKDFREDCQAFGIPAAKGKKGGSE